jgi:hypothetical protein
MPRWRIDLIGKRLQHVGTVEAATWTDAVEAAVKELGVDPALRDKLVVTKVPETKLGLKGVSKGKR